MALPHVDPNGTVIVTANDKSESEHGARARVRLRASEERPTREFDGASRVVRIRQPEPEDARAFLRRPALETRLWVSSLQCCCFSMTASTDTRAGSSAPRKRAGFLDTVFTAWAHGSA